MKVIAYRNVAASNEDALQGHWRRFKCFMQQMGLGLY
jgi:hypothetical protein